MTETEWQRITLETAAVRVEVSWDSFRIFDKRDTDNCTMAIAPRRAGKRAVQRMRKWALSANSESIAGLTFSGVRALLQTQGIDCHVFCAM